MKVAKDNDELVEHEDSLCSHPGHGDHGEVVNEDREDGAADLMLHAADPDGKEKEHAEHGQTQLDVELAGLLLSYFPENRLKGEGEKCSNISSYLVGRGNERE